MSVVSDEIENLQLTLKKNNAINCNMKYENHNILETEKSLI